MMSFQTGDIVSHFKRQFADPDSKDYLYEIIGEAMHTETNETLIVYQALYEPYPMFARPKDMFLSKVDKEKYPEVQQIYRFEKVNK
ncbi:MAG: DUF1653 domain-containing protein [Erysipelotrichaceae bacterium]|nr:DUF1653 domain-containing protein [Erysipelotrichaceae bacterium]